MIMHVLFCICTFFGVLNFGVLKTWVMKIAWNGKVQDDVMMLFCFGDNNFF
jgi:hypothetical protein